MDTNWKNWIISLFITVLAALLMKIGFPVPDLIRLETSPNAQLMQKYILAIHPDHGKAYHLLFWNTFADYFFLLGYSLLTYFSLKILLDVFGASAGSWVWVASFITGFFDILEDNFLINAALRHQEDFSLLYYYIVRVKWALALIPFSIIIVTIVYGVVLASSAKQSIKQSN